MLGLGGGQSGGNSPGGTDRAWPSTELEAVRRKRFQGEICELVNAFHLFKILKIYSCMIIYIGVE